MARRTFFTFHYGNDVQRASVVRKSDMTQTRDAAGFFDASLWESSRRKGDESLKELMRNAVKNTTVTCVLAGAETYLRRWVRYEIVRSVLNGNGLLTVQIAGIRDFQQKVSAQGRDPLDYLGLYRADDGIYFAEWKNGGWATYNDYTLAVPEKDLWFRVPSNKTIQLSTHSQRYDYVADDGYSNLGDWIDRAAKDAGHSVYDWI